VPETVRIIYSYQNDSKWGEGGFRRKGEKQKHADPKEEERKKSNHCKAPLTQPGTRHHNVGGVGGVLVQCSLFKKKRKASKKAGADRGKIGTGGRDGFCGSQKRPVITSRSTLERKESR